MLGRALFFITAIFCAFAFGQSSSIVYGGQGYKTVKMPDGKVWFAENINYAMEGSVCYDKNSENCRKCGRLYDWAMANAVCPNGWHLPTDAEWSNLEKAVGGYAKAGTVLKAKNGWNGNGNGTDIHGFSARSCGSLLIDGSFQNYGSRTVFWSATEDDSELAWFRYLEASSAGMLRNYNIKANLFSVRCVKD